MFVKPALFPFPSIEVPNVSAVKTEFLAAIPVFDVKRIFR